MQGLHLTADLFQCTCDQALMVCADTIAQLCRSQTQASGLTLVDDKWVKFPEWQGQPGGVTGAVLLAESHLAIHTWPETGNVTIDVYVCNFSDDNSAKAQALMDGVVAAYAPKEAVRQQLWRGDISTDPVGQYPWVMERLTDDAAFGLRAHNVQRTQTPFQTLEMMDTPSFGRVMRLDNCFMTSERDEFFYHECMAHPAAMAHPQPQQALIIGGGDGGLAEELLKHNTLQRVVLAELDEAVIEASKAQLHAVHRNVWADARLQLQIGDGMAYVDSTSERFDLICMDLTDPDTPAGSLYSAAALQRMQRVLRPGGRWCCIWAAPSSTPSRCASSAPRCARPLPRWPATACMCRCTARTGAWQYVQTPCSPPAWAQALSPSVWPSAAWAICSTTTPTSTARCLRCLTTTASGCRPDRGSTSK